MALLEYIRRRKFIVTVRDRSDLNTVYSELETDGKTPQGLDLLRPIDCIDRRPTSRNTVYLMTDWEAAALRQDPRIISVELEPAELGISAGINSTTQTSSDWNKSNTTSSTNKNWGLLRCVEGEQRVGWGGTGRQGNGVGTAAQTGTITLTQTGRNVDVVVCDENGLVWNHPEFAVNADGTGGTRTIQYNWYQHNPAVKGTAAGSYSYGVGAHSTHVAGTVAGNTQGWARDSNIYNLYYLAGDDLDYTFPYVYDYIRQFHATKPVNVNTGRRNPTIVNNSWGMSIFPPSWSLSDITAVTYRGIRYTPAATPTTFLGTSGVCNANSKLADLLNLEAGGNRITTTGPSPAGAGNITSRPGTWSQEGGQAYITETTAPAATYAVVVQGPCTVTLFSNVASGGIAGVTTLSIGITAATSVGVIIASYNQGPTSSGEGGNVELTINEVLNLPLNEAYTLTFTTALTYQEVASPLTAFAMSVTVSVATGAESASVAGIASSLLGAAALTASTTPSVGSNDDGYWTLNLPFGINFLGNTYNTIYVGTNTYVTFGAGSTQYLNVSPTTPNLPKIMWCAKDNSVQRIYYGVEGAEVGTFTVINSGSGAYVINGSSNPTLTLKRGSTYTFNISAGGHPFWIKTVSSLGTSNAYNSGVTNNGTQSGTITFTVPNDAPATLYYNCQFHISMKGTIDVVSSTQTYRVRIEGNASTGGTLGSPGMVCEYVFYENTPAQIDLQVGVNNAKQNSSGFSTAQLNAWGFISGQRIPARVAALDADIEDAIDEGIVNVGAAGNGRWKHSIPGDADWNNTFEMGIRYPASVSTPYYYMQGSSPTANDSTSGGTYDLPNICVGAVDSIQIDQKVIFSDCGSGVDLWAPGTAIVSAYTSGIADPRNASYYVYKIDGTSMASPQVCGVLACALEVYPRMTQEEAKAYILFYTKLSQLTATNGGPTDAQDLQGAPNKFLFYYKERQTTGNIFPKINFKTRPTSGAVWPRPRIRRTI